jgi:hypothetical protein
MLKGRNLRSLHRGFVTLEEKTKLNESVYILTEAAKYKLGKDSNPLTKARHSPQYHKYCIDKAAKDSMPSLLAAEEHQINLASNHPVTSGRNSNIFLTEEYNGKKPILCRCFR